MNKYTPYLLPLVVLSVVFFLVFRWYNARTEQLRPDLFGEGVQIENLTDDELLDTFDESSDLETVQLERVAPPTTEDETAEPETPAATLAEGVIRYTVQDDRARFSVIVTLPMEAENYHVWIRDAETDTDRYVFTLSEQKGGFLGSASIPVDQLPVEVLVARGSQTEMGTVLLRGTLEAPATE